MTATDMRTLIKNATCISASTYQQIMDRLRAVDARACQIVTLHHVYGKKWPKVAMEMYMSIRSAQRVLHNAIERACE